MWEFVCVCVCFSKIKGVSDNLDPIVSQTARKQVQVESAQLEATNETKQPKNQQNANKTGQKLNRCASQSHKNLNKSALIALSATTTEVKCENGNNGSGNLLSVDDQTVHLSSLPEMSPYERYVCSLAHMNEILLRNHTLEDTVSAQETCAILIEHVMRLTATKRDLLEAGLVQAASIEDDAERAKFQAGLRERAHRVRGKLDHASIVAYEVGHV